MELKSGSHSHFSFPPSFIRSVSQTRADDAVPMLFLSLNGLEFKIWDFPPTSARTFLFLYFFLSSDCLPFYYFILSKGFTDTIHDDHRIDHDRQTMFSIFTSLYLLLSFFSLREDHSRFSQMSEDLYIVKTSLSLHLSIAYNFITRNEI